MKLPVPASISLLCSEMRKGNEIGQLLGGLFTTTHTSTLPSLSLTLKTVLSRPTTPTGMRNEHIHHALIRETEGYIGMRVIHVIIV